MAEHDWKPHRISGAQQKTTRAPIYLYMRDKQRGTVSSSSRFKTVLLQQYSTNLSVGLLRHVTPRIYILPYIYIYIYVLHIIIVVIITIYIYTHVYIYIYVYM